MKDNSLVSQLIDEPVFHYSISLADDIIDIITTEKPELRQWLAFFQENGVMNLTIGQFMWSSMILANEKIIYKHCDK